MLIMLMLQTGAYGIIIMLIMLITHHAHVADWRLRLLHLLLLPRQRKLRHLWTPWLWIFAPPSGGSLWLFACRRRFGLLIFVFNICCRFRARLLTSPPTIGLASSSRLPTTRKSNLALFGELSSTSASPVKPHKGALALTKVHLPLHQLQLYLKI